jgi:hypothetical protein
MILMYSLINTKNYLDIKTCLHHQNQSMINKAQRPDWDLLAQMIYEENQHAILV